MRALSGFREERRGGYTDDQVVVDRFAFSLSCITSSSKERLVFTIPLLWDQSRLWNSSSRSHLDQVSGCLFKWFREVFSRASVRVESS